MLRLSDFVCSTAKEGASRFGIEQIWQDAYPEFGIWNVCSRANIISWKSWKRASFCTSCEVGRCSLDSVHNCQANCGMHELRSSRNFKKKITSPLWSWLYFQDYQSLSFKIEELASSLSLKIGVLASSLRKSFAVVLFLEDCVMSGPEAGRLAEAGSADAVPRDKTLVSVLPIFLTSEGIEHGTCGSKMKRKGLLVFVTHPRLR